MSVHVHNWDRASRVLWLIYEGRGDELEANLRGYCVEYVGGSSGGLTRHGWIGICYRPGMSDADRNLFMDSAIELLELLTARSGISPAQERRFAAELATVQNYQCHVTAAAF